MRNRVQNETSNCELIEVGLKEQSAPGYPSTTKQSVTEVNFHSIDDGMAAQHAIKLATKNH